MNIRNSRINKEKAKKIEEVMAQFSTTRPKAKRMLKIQEFAARFGQPMTLEVAKTILDFEDQFARASRTSHVTTASALREITQNLQDAGNELIIVDSDDKTAYGKLQVWGYGDKANYFKPANIWKLFDFGAKHRSSDDDHANHYGHGEKLVLAALGWKLVFMVQENPDAPVYEAVIARHDPDDCPYGSNNIAGFISITRVADLNLYEEWVSQYPNDEGKVGSGPITLRTYSYDENASAEDYSDQKGRNDDSTFRALYTPKTKYSSWSAPKAYTKRYYDANPNVEIRLKANKQYSRAKSFKTAVLEDSTTIDRCSRSLEGSDLVLTVEFASLGKDPGYGVNMTPSELSGIYFKLGGEMLKPPRSKALTDMGISIENNPVVILELNPDLVIWKACRTALMNTDGSDFNAHIEKAYKMIRSQELSPASLRITPELTNEKLEETFDDLNKVLREGLRARHATPSSRSPRSKTSSVKNTTSLAPTTRRLGGFAKLTYTALADDSYCMHLFENASDGRVEEIQINIDSSGLRNKSGRYFRSRHPQDAEKLMNHFDDSPGFRKLMAMFHWAAYHEASATQVLGYKKKKYNEDQKVNLDQLAFPQDIGATQLKQLVKRQLKYLQEFGESEAECLDVEDL